LSAALTAIRASSLPMAFACPASIRGELRLDQTSDAASEGTAAHKIMEQISGRDLSSLDDIDVVGIADLHRIDAEALRMHAVNGIWMWKRIRPAFVIGTRGEAELSATIAGINVTGHVDLMASDDEIANLADWKFGRLDRDYYHQLAGYMALALKAHPNFKRVTASICWMRDREIEPYSMDREQAEAWEAHLEAEIVRWDGRTFRPGAHCAHCPRFHDCPAVLAEVKALVAMFGDVDAIDKADGALSTMPGSEIMALYRRTKMVAKFCESLQDLVKVKADRDGPIAGGDGYELRYVASDGARVVDPLKAWPVLQEKFSDDEIGAFTKVSISAAEKLMRAKAPPRKGAEFVRRFAAELEAVGAVSKKPSRAFREVRLGNNKEKNHEHQRSSRLGGPVRAHAKHHRARPGRAPACAG
jgi:hypothetical protein